MAKIRKYDIVIVCGINGINQAINDKNNEEERNNNGENEEDDIENNQ